MTNGPKIWDPILTAVAAAYGSAVVAGGAVRDWQINKNINPRDIDVFVQVDSELDLEMGAHALRETWMYATLIEPDQSAYSADELKASNVTGVLEGVQNWARENTKINVIGKAFDVYDTDRLFADFDHSLCQFAYTGEEERSSEAARLTLDTGVVNVYNPSRRTQVRLDTLFKRKKAYERFSYPAGTFPEAVVNDQYSTLLKYIDMNGVRSQTMHVVMPQNAFNELRFVGGINNV